MCALYHSGWVSYNVIDTAVLEYWMDHVRQQASQKGFEIAVHTPFSGKYSDLLFDDVVNEVVNRTPKGLDLYRMIVNSFPNDWGFTDAPLDKNLFVPRRPAKGF